MHLTGRRMMLNFVFACSVFAAVGATGVSYLASPASAEEAVVAPPPAGRDSFTRQELESAVVLGDARLRLWGDDPDAFRAALDGAVAEGQWLSISGGAENGAFGAGLLAGWTASGDRPAFSVVTGVSTGALMAPYVFLGSQYDPELKLLYTTTTPPDVFEIGDGGRGESLLDTWPLRELIARRVTRRFLAAVANEHRKGRRLFVLTTSVDAQRPIVWDMGAIAARGDKGLSLFRDVLLASASIPGVFPPVYIDAEVNGRRLREMHIDGAAYAPFYVAPEALLRSESSEALPASAVTVILNQKLGPEFGRTERNTLAILGRSLAVGVKAAVRGNVSMLHGFCRRTELRCDFALIQDGFEAASRGVFDPNYMNALYDFGRQQGTNAAARWNETAFSATGAVPVRQQAGRTQPACPAASAERPQPTAPTGTAEPANGLGCSLTVPVQ